jgi:hypothetical protein
MRKEPLSRDTEKLRAFQQTLNQLRLLAVQASNAIEGQSSSKNRFTTRIIP